MAPFLSGALQATFEQQGFWKEPPPDKLNTIFYYEYSLPATIVVSITKLLSVILGFYLVWYVHKREKARLALGEWDPRSKKPYLLPVYRGFLYVMLVLFISELILLNFWEFNTDLSYIAIGELFIQSLICEGFVHPLTGSSVSARSILYSLIYVLGFSIYGALMGFMVAATLQWQGVQGYSFVVLAMYHFFPLFYHAYIIFPFSSSSNVTSKRLPIKSFSRWMFIYRLMWMIFNIVAFVSIITDFGSPLLYNATIGILSLFELPFSFVIFAMVRVDTVYWHYGAQNFLRTYTQQIASENKQFNQGGMSISTLDDKQKARAFTIPNVTKYLIDYAYIPDSDRILQSLPSIEKDLRIVVRTHINQVREQEQIHLERQRLLLARAEEQQRLQLFQQQQQQQQLQQQGDGTNNCGIQQPLSLPKNQSFGNLGAIPLGRIGTPPSSQLVSSLVNDNHFLSSGSLLQANGNNNSTTNLASPTSTPVHNSLSSLAPIKLNKPANHVASSHSKESTIITPMSLPPDPNERFASRPTNTIKSKQRPQLLPTRDEIATLPEDNDQMVQDMIPFLTEVNKRQFPLDPSDDLNDDDDDDDGGNDGDGGMKNNPTPNISMPGGQGDNPLLNSSLLPNNQRHQHHGDHLDDLHGNDSSNNTNKNTNADLHISASTPTPHLVPHHNHNNNNNTTTNSTNHNDTYQAPEIVGFEHQILRNDPFPLHVAQYGGFYDVENPMGQSSSFSTSKLQSSKSSLKDNGGVGCCRFRPQVCDIFTFGLYSLFDNFWRYNNEDQGDEEETTMLPSLDSTFTNGLDQSAPDVTDFNAAIQHPQLSLLNDADTKILDLLQQVIDANSRSLIALNQLEIFSNKILGQGTFAFVFMGELSLRAAQQKIRKKIVFHNRTNRPRRFVGLFDVFVHSIARQYARAPQTMLAQTVLRDSSGSSGKFTRFQNGVGVPNKSQFISQQQQPQQLQQQQQQQQQQQFANGRKSNATATKSTTPISPITPTDINGDLEGEQFIHPTTPHIHDEQDYGNMDSWTTRVLKTLFARKAESDLHNDRLDLDLTKYLLRSQDMYSTTGIWQLQFQSYTILSRSHCIISMLPCLPHSNRQDHSSISIPLSPQSTLFGTILSPNASQDIHKLGFSIFELHCLLSLTTLLYLQQVVYNLYKPRLKSKKYRFHPSQLLHSGMSCTNNTPINTDKSTSGVHFNPGQLYQQDNIKGPRQGSVGDSVKKIANFVLRVFDSYRKNTNSGKDAFQLLYQAPMVNQIQEQTYQSVTTLGNQITFQTDSLAPEVLQRVAEDPVLKNSALSFDSSFLDSYDDPDNFLFINLQNEQTQSTIQAYLGEYQKESSIPIQQLLAPCSSVIAKIEHNRRKIGYLNSLLSISSSSSSTPSGSLGSSLNSSGGGSNNNNSSFLNDTAVNPPNYPTSVFLQPQLNTLGNVTSNPDFNDDGLYTSSRIAMPSSFNHPGGGSAQSQLFSPSFLGNNSLVIANTSSSGYLFSNPSSFGSSSSQLYPNSYNTNSVNNMVDLQLDPSTPSLARTFSNSSRFSTVNSSLSTTSSIRGKTTNNIILNPNNKSQPNNRINLYDLDDENIKKSSHIPTISVRDQQQRVVDTVAVKFFKKTVDFSPAAVVAIAEETSLHCKMQHPNIVYCYGILVAPPTLAVITEICARGDLFGLIEAQGNLRKRFLHLAELTQSLLIGFTNITLKSHNNNSTNANNTTSTIAGLPSLSESPSTATTTAAAPSTTTTTFTSESLTTSTNHYGLLPSLGSMSNLLVKKYDLIKEPSSTIEQPQQPSITTLATTTSQTTPALTPTNSQTSTTSSPALSAPLIRATELLNKMNTKSIIKSLHFAHRRLALISTQLWNLRTRLLFAIDAATAVAYCHSKQLLHRDIKSLNFFVNDNNVVKLADFGISKQLTERVTDLDSEHRKLIYSHPAFRRVGVDVETVVQLLNKPNFPHDDGPRLKLDHGNDVWYVDFSSASRRVDEFQLAAKYATQLSRQYFQDHVIAKGQKDTMITNSFTPPWSDSTPDRLDYGQLLAHTLLQRVETWQIDHNLQPVTDFYADTIPSQQQQQQFGGPSSSRLGSNHPLSRSNSQEKDDSHQQQARNGTAAATSTTTTTPTHRRPTLSSQIQRPAYAFPTPAIFMSPEQAVHGTINLNDVFEQPPKNITPKDLRKLEIERLSLLKQTYGSPVQKPFPDDIFYDPLGELLNVISLDGNTPLFSITSLSPNRQLLDIEEDQMTSAPEFAEFGKFSFIFSPQPAPHIDEQEMARLGITTDQLPEQGITWSFFADTSKFHSRSGISKHTTNRGTPQWLAPEAFDCPSAEMVENPGEEPKSIREYSYPVDIYALGLTLWEILCVQPMDARDLDSSTLKFTRDIPFQLRLLLLASIDQRPQLRPTARQIVDVLTIHLYMLDFVAMYINNSALLKL